LLRRSLSGQTKSASRNRANRRPRRTRRLDNEGIIPVLARAVREIESEAQRGRVSPPSRTRYQVVALLVREERARVKEDQESTEAQRAEQLKRLDGLATILAKTAARDTTLLALLAEDAEVSDAARSLKRKMLEAAGREVTDEPEPEPERDDVPGVTERRVIPQSVIARQLANPFQVPDFEAAAKRIEPRTHRLANWELIGPLLRAFEVGNGAPACLDMPDPRDRRTPNGLEMMRHQAQLVAAVKEGHRTFLLADEPGLGKTAQALLA